MYWEFFSNNKQMNRTSCSQIQTIKNQFLLSLSKNISQEKTAVYLLYRSPPQDFLLETVVIITISHPNMYCTLAMSFTHGVTFHMVNLTSANLVSSFYPVITMQGCSIPPGFLLPFTLITQAWFITSRVGETAGSKEKNLWVCQSLSCLSRLCRQ